MVNIMPGEGYTGGAQYGKVEPGVGSHYTEGPLFEVKATGINGGKFLRWQVSDFQSRTGTGQTNPRYTTDNPLVLHCEGVDAARFNETYRTFWVNAEFQKPSSLLTKIGRRLGLVK